jgi:hypothetical protein
MNNLQHNVDVMIRNWQSLLGTWDNTQEAWKDTSRNQFEREHINELRQTTNNYISSLKRLSENIQSISREIP